MDVYVYVGAGLGFVAFFMVIAAFQKIGELEAELKRCSNAKKAPVEATRSQVVVARNWKLVLFYAVLGVAVLLLSAAVYFEEKV